MKERKATRPNAVVECERCRVVKVCAFYGSPADPERENQNQSGGWVCGECLPLMSGELDEAIARLEDALGDEE